MTATEPTMRSDEEILGRIDVNDVDAITELARANVDPDEVAHAVADQADALFTWDYEKAARPKLDKLYEKAKTSQWNAQTDLDWSIEVDRETAFKFIPVEDDPEAAYWRDNPESPVANWGDKEWDQFELESFAWRLSQFLHGEQGALLCTAKIVETVPWIDAKYYAATQVVDEARHVEVFDKYIDEKLDLRYPINPHLRMLLDDIINDSRWDMTYLGMQIMVEGLALAAFGFMHQLTHEPLLKKLLRYVMSDEARHVAFGVLSLQEVYGEMDGCRHPRASGVRLRGRRPHAGPLPAAGGLGEDGCRHQGGLQARARHARRAQDLPATAVLEDRPQLQEAGPDRRRGRLAA